jgi:tetratricopeptide (TPR) repeat protein
MGKGSGLIFIMTCILLCTSCNDNNGKTEEIKTRNQPDSEIPGPAPAKGTAATDAKEQALAGMIAKYPDSLVLKENLIQYYRENENYDRARAVIAEALKKDSNNARLYDIKATLAYEDQDTATAISSFEKAIEIYPEPEYVIALATLYAQQKNPKALHLADALIRGSKANADKEALFIKGLYYSAIGEKQKSLSYFDQALQMSYTFMEAYREKALSLYSLGKYQEALNVMDKALTVQNSWDEGYYFSGMILEKMGRKEDAIVSYQNALSISPDYDEARDALAKLGVH